MRHDSIISSRFGTRLGHVALFALLAVVPVLALNSFATADTGSDPSADHGGRPALTTSQQECLAGQGVTRPTTGTGAERPSLTTEQRRAVRAAARACGLRGPWSRFAPGALTDEQRQCLAAQGLTPPPPSGEGPRPSVTGAERIAALRRAAEACGLSRATASGTSAGRI